MIRMILSSAFTLHQLGRLLSSFVKLVGPKMVSQTLQQFAAARALKTLIAFNAAKENNNVDKESNLTK